MTTISLPGSTAQHCQLSLENNRQSTPRRVLNLLGLTLLLATPSSSQLLPADTQTFASPLPLTNYSGDFGESLAWVDVDGDGREDLVATYRDIVLDVSYVRVYRSTSTGLVLLPTELAFSDPPVVAGCDFDPTRSGEEVVIGVARLDVSFNGTQAGAGGVFVYGWNTDSTPPAELAQFTQVTVPDATAEAGDEFGAALATGDFDGDQQCDLAIGAPEEDIDAFNNLGTLYVRWGPLGGGTWSDELEVRDFAMATPVGNNNRFAEVLTAGDLDGDGNDELVVGSPDNDDQGTNVGNVWVLTHDSFLAVPFQGQRLVPSDVGLTDDPFADFGASVAVGDLTGDGIGDLAIGAPEYQASSGLPGSGVVTVIPGSLGGALSLGAAEHRDIGDLGLTADSDDEFGQQVAIARVLGGVALDLIVGASGVPDLSGTVNRVGLVALFRGDNDLTHETTLRQSDLPGESDEHNDFFGEVIVAGDADGDGAPDLAFGVPGEDFVDRGISPGQDLGVVHVVPAVSRLRPAEILATAGEVYLGQGPVDTIEPPRDNPAGDAAFTFTSTLGNDFAATTSQVLSSSTDLLPAVGIDAQGNSVWVDRADGELFSSTLGLVFADGQPFPGGGFFDFTSNDDLWLRGTQQMFFLTQRNAPLERVLLKTDLTTSSSTIELASGQTIGGMPVSDILLISSSPSGQHWAAVIDSLGSPMFVIDGSLSATRDVNGGGISTVTGLAIGDDGLAAVSISGEDQNSGLAGTDDGTIYVDSNGSVDDIPLDDHAAFDVALSSRGEMISLWGTVALGGGDLLALSCRPDSTARSPDSGMSAASPPGSFAERGLPSTPTARVLVKGDPLDTDGDGRADAAIELLSTERGDAPEVSDDGWITVRATITRDSDPTPVTALVRMPSPVCPSFADGFESADTTAWSATVP